jgi:hypothetical protein
VSDLNIRSTLWKEFGIPFSDMTPADIPQVMDWIQGSAIRAKSLNGRR